MPIRNVTGNVTGGIGPIRYVENGVTVNIPIAYVVENGKTALVYKETADTSEYTPTGDTYYLYNRGTISEAIGSFEFTGNGNTIYQQKEGYLSFMMPKGVSVDAYVKSTRLMNLTEYKHLYIEYDYVNPSTGAIAEHISTAYTIELRNDYNEGKYQIMTLIDHWGIGSDSGFWRECILEMYTSNIAISETEDVELRIYSIYITKA